MQVAKTKALISFAVTAKLICVFVFAYADCWFSHGAAHIFGHIFSLLSEPIIKIFAELLGLLKFKRMTGSYSKGVSDRRNLEEGSF